MPAFQVTFATRDGQVGVERLDAESEREVLARLESDGRTAIEIRARAAASDRDRPSRRRAAPMSAATPEAAPPRTAAAPPPTGSRNPRRAVLELTQQLASVVESGIPILSGLRIITEQTGHAGLRAALRRVAQRIEGGDALADALSGAPEFFPAVFVKSIAAGEAAGSLSEVLDSLARYMEADIENRSRIRSAMVYPMLVVGALCGATALMLWFVIPQFAAMFDKLGGELPFMTRLLVALSEFLRRQFALLALLAFAAPMIWRRVFNRPGPRYWLHGLQLRLPVIGPVILAGQMHRLMELLNLMNRSALPIVQGLRVTADSMENVRVRRDVHAVADEVEGGQSLGEALARSRWITPLVRQMLSVAEHAGSTDRILEYLTRYYADRTRRSIKTLSTLIEPALITGLAVVVLMFSLAIFLPMWRMLKLVGAG